MEPPDARRFRFAMLGPGLLFAATSVGTSHLVQSTRAGAMYGLALLIIVILINAFKYPAFRFASDYFPATGNTLLDAYQRQGKSILMLFAVITLISLLFAVSVLALLCAGLLATVFNFPIQTNHLAVGLILATAALLVFGRYQALERVSKLLVVLMAIGTILLAAVAAPNIGYSGISDLLPNDLDRAGLIFVAALIGWMPVPLEASVWQSLWAKSKGITDKKVRRISISASRFDFNLGYFGTTALAICFLIIGAGLVHSSGMQLASGSIELSNQLVGLYSNAFGSYAKSIVGILAFAVVFSSLLTVMDAFPRTLSSLYRKLRGISVAEETYILSKYDLPYIFTLIVMALIAVVTYRYFLTSLTVLIDIATTVAFVFAPVIAILNHRAITGADVPADFQPGRAFRMYSVFCIMALSIFAFGYMFLQFGVRP